MRVYHGTRSDYAGTPEPRTDCWGFTGVFVTENPEAASRFATSIQTEARDDGVTRLFIGEIEEVYIDLDLAHMQDALDDDYEGTMARLLEMVEASDANMVALPDINYTGQREILVRDGRVEWEREFHSERGEVWC